MTIETQIARFDRSVEEFIRCVIALEEELLLRNINGWSTRDIVTHLVGWNRYIIEGSNQIMRGELPFYDIDPGEDYSKVNAVLVREYSSKNKHELLDELRASAQELIQFLRSLGSSEWEQDYGVRHKEQIITIKNTVDELIEDYDIHRERIANWAAS